MTGTNRNLLDAVKRLAFKTSIEQLKKKGVQQVNVVGVDRLTALIEEAVHRTLKNRMMGLERDAIADATKAEFLRMLQKNEDLAKQHDEVARLKERAEDEVLLLKKTLEDQKLALQDRLSFVEADIQEQYAGENSEIALLFDALFKEQIAAPVPNLTVLRDQIVAKTIHLLDKERAAAMLAREHQHARDLDLLERRVTKLKEALAENEQRMALAASMAPGDPGLASIYRSVQGLLVGDANFAKKKELMSGIFEANLALKRSVAKV